MRSKGTKFWAWMVSIVVHLIVLAVFGVAKFSKAVAQDSLQPPVAAKINRVRQLIETSPVIPKPKITPAKDRSMPTTAQILSTKKIFELPKPSSMDLADFAKPSAVTDRLAVGDESSSKQVGFFGTTTDRRKLCYVVDCSGSMKGLFARVKKQLKDSIASLQQDQYFYIIFFGDGRVFEFRDGKLIRATAQAVSSANSFIDSAEPSGRTNAMAALERAAQICTDSSNGLSVIYFLTDGFELTNQDSQGLPYKLKTVLAQFAPTTRINTIGFWPTDDDREMLKLIAGQSGGEFVSVSDAK